MTYKEVTYKTWIRARYDEFEKLFPDNNTYLHPNEQISIYYIHIDEYVFQFAITEQEYLKNTPRGRMTLWGFRLADLKVQIEDHLVPFQFVIDKLK